MRHKLPHDLDTRQREHHDKNTMNSDNKQTPIQQLLSQTPCVVNVGLESFSDDLESQQVSVIQLDWRPPAGGDPELADLLSRLGS